MLRPLSISFEFFPPKTSTAMAVLCHSAEQLLAAHPHFFSVTFGAGGSTRDGTLETVKKLQQDLSVAIVPHLACIGETQSRLTEMVKQYQVCGVRRIVALRGDLPSGMGSSVSDFNYAYQLVELIRRVSGDYFHIEVAAYPEFHPQAKSTRQDILNLKRKYEAGANSAITQYFFNPDAYFYFLDDCVRSGISLPIVPGIMPITQFNKLVHFSNMCGAEIPKWIYQRLHSYGDDIDSIRAVGREIVVMLCEKLIAGGAPGLHFYTLNKADASMQILQDLKLCRPYYHGYETTRGSIEKEGMRRS
jgi:methylenetetrahydrofolate reductase (NADPH)